MVGRDDEVNNILQIIFRLQHHQSLRDIQSSIVALTREKGIEKAKYGTN